MISLTLICAGGWLWTRLLLGSKQRELEATSAKLTYERSLNANNEIVRGIYRRQAQEQNALIEQLRDLLQQEQVRSVMYQVKVEDNESCGCGVDLHDRVTAWERRLMAKEGGV